VAALQNKGFTVEQLNNQSGETPATVVNITDALLEGDTPGYLQVFTHGMTGGALMTADYLGDTNERAVSSLQDLLTKIRLNYPSFPTDAVTIMFAPKIPAEGFASLTPQYWTWLRSKGADFSRSLVYMSACLTDQTTASPPISALNAAIQARAYFAYSEEASQDLASAVAAYLPDLLSRPTTSAEEVYYWSFPLTRSLVT
jgi:hypothetical protein